MTCGIYAIFSEQAKIIYVGQSSQIEQRWRGHRHNLSQPHGASRCNKRLRNAWKKYGSDCFYFIVLEECDLSELTHREIFWLQRARSMPQWRVANTEGPVDNPMRGQRHTPETIERLRKASSSFPRTDAHRQAIGNAHRGRAMSEETKLKLSIAKIGKKNPLLAGDNNPSRRPEHRARMSGDGNPAKRDDVKARLSVSRCRSVVDIDTGDSWPSRSACASSLGVSVTAVSNCIIGKVSSCKGRRLADQKITHDTQRLAAAAS